MLSCLSGYEEAFEKDEDVGGIIRRILAKRRDEVVPEKGQENRKEGLLRKSPRQAPRNPKQNVWALAKSWVRTIHST
jgi:hypothetical protein